MEYLVVIGIEGRGRFVYLEQVICCEGDGCAIHILRGVTEYVGDVVNHINDYFLIMGVF